MYCKVCGDPLGDPEEDLHDPDNKAGIIEGGVENPDSAHIKVVDGPGSKDNHRFQCANKGQITSLVQEPPPEDPDPSGGEPNENRQPSPTTQPTVDEVYDIDGPQSSDAIVIDVVRNPIYGLSDEQLMEIKDWVDIYDGQIPPDDLEAILSDFNSVADQTARLMRKKYEAKLNREMRKRAEEDKGPSIGSLGRGAQLPQGGRGGHPPPQQPPPSGGQQPERPSPAENGSSEPSGENDLRTERRRRRIERRNDAFDEAVEEFAHQAASEMAAGAGGLFGDISDALGTAIKTKAQKDPDWFFEKMEQWDIDVLDAFLEPSEAKKQELDRGAKPGSQVDQEVQEALESLDSGEEQQEEYPTETAVGDNEMEQILAEEEEENPDRIELDDVMGDA